MEKILLSKISNAFQNSNITYSNTRIRIRIYVFVFTYSKNRNDKKIAMIDSFTGAQKKAVP